MKKIAVLVPSFTIEYCQDFLSGVTDYFKDKDVKLIISQTQIEHNDTGLYDYQYWSCVNTLYSKEIDAYIIPAGLYTVRKTIKQLQESFAPFQPRPIICSAMDLGLENSYIVKINCEESISELVKHLKEKHNCKHIGFVSANSTKSTEALDRFDFFKKALKQNDLELNPDFIFDGFFTDFGAHDDLKSKLHSKEDVHFDALICANDNMAIGAIKALSELGLKIPEDVKITGFDNSPLSYFSSPRLSTVDQNIYEQGKYCSDLAFRVLNGESFPKENFFIPSTLYRQSCGCIPHNNRDSIYVDKNGTEFKEPDQMSSYLSIMANDVKEKMNVTTILDMIRSSNTLRQLFYNLKYLTNQAELDSLFISLYDIPVYADRKTKPVYPEKVELSMFANNITYESQFDTGTVFDTREKIFPPQAETEGPGNYILHPIFAGESIFGFLTCKLQTKKFPSYQVYLKILSSAISQSYEYTKKILQTEKLSTEVTQLSDLAKTDELTGLLNRRGFMEVGQRTLDILQEISNAGVVFFADMDGLKHINDTYGHKMGDKAIQTQAEILKKVFRSSDIIGRLSGDEFAIIANGMFLERAPIVRQKILTTSAKLSRENNLPFTVSLSIGAVDLEGGSSLQTLLSKADNLLYEEKKRKHSMNK